ncbi:hypothetical protein BX600DRAFT_433262 [Xylariales sp. PMI_506]|nr:hypothetical protein BX600DRAFT_433262 [Xylariales sp. PMI_506]
MTDLASPAIDPSAGKSSSGGKKAKERLLADLTAKLEESRKLAAESEELQRKADEADPEEAEKLRADAWEREQKAKKLIRQANRLQTGAFQGGAAGAGIGAGIAGGLGTLIGGLVGGIAAIPTAGLGVLVGAGVGAVHGPWVKLVKDTVKEQQEEEETGQESPDLVEVSAEPEPDVEALPQKADQKSEAKGASGEHKETS